MLEPLLVPLVLLLPLLRGVWRTREASAAAGASGCWQAVGPQDRQQAQLHAPAAGELASPGGWALERAAAVGLLGLLGLRWGVATWQVTPGQVTAHQHDQTTWARLVARHRRLAAAVAVAVAASASAAAAAQAAPAVPAAAQSLARPEEAAAGAAHARGQQPGWWGRRVGAQRGCSTWSAMTAGLQGPRELPARGVRLPEVPAQQQHRDQRLTSRHAAAGPTQTAVRCCG